MINRGLTRGSTFPMTDLETLNKKREEYEDRFPPMYFPKYYEENPGFIKTPDREVSVGINRQVVFLIATKTGAILNNPTLSSCQLPAEGYLGRYELYPDGIDDPTYRGVEPRLTYVCTYWINYREIGLYEESGEDGMMGFVALDNSDLPKKLLDSLNDPRFISKYLYI